VKFFRFGYPVVVGILPKTQFGEDGITGVDDPIAIPSVFPLVELGKGEKTIRMARGGLVRLVSKQLAAIVDIAVAVSVQAKERVVGTRSRPSYTR